MAMVDALPRILWVALRPPVPPLFSGGAIRAQSAIAVLSELTEVEVLTFAPHTEAADLLGRARRYWSGSPVSLQVIEPGRRIAALAALRRRRFQSGIPIETSALPEYLEEMAWDAPESLVVFDDILFAPLLPRYGCNALLSPNDCVSEMFHSHARIANSVRARLKCSIQHRIARHYETAFYHHALLTHLVTARDRILLQQVNPRARYHVAPYTDYGLAVATSSVPAYTWDVAVWADLAVASSIQGTKAFLDAVAADPEWHRIRLAVVGRIPGSDAERLLGHATFSRVEYSRFLEDEEGRMRHARVTVVPDVGGTGIKSRCLGLLASGRCVACLYAQMEGIQDICDVGAVNAATPTALADRIKRVLREETYAEIADAGHTFFASEFSQEVLKRKWADLVRRALAIRDALQPTQAPELRGAKQCSGGSRHAEATRPATPHGIEPAPLRWKAR